MEKNIAVIRGDGIGPEIVNEAVKVLNRVSERFGHRFNYIDITAGCAGLDLYGDALRKEDYDAACAADALLFGSIGDDRKYTFNGENGTKKYKSRAESAAKALIPFRKGMQLYVNIRPTRVYPQLLGASPLRPEIAAGTDLVVARENTAGSYFGAKTYGEKDGQLAASDDCVYTRAEIERHARKSFDLAMARRKKLTMAGKWNVMDTSRLWQVVYDEVAKDYPEVEYNQMLTDNCAMQIVLDPTQFDVIATDNLFGDILSDLASGVAGSLGMACSGSVGNGSWGLYECAGGSAPDIAGKNIANPLAEILSAGMMLRYSLGMPKEADAVEAAVNKALDAGLRTPDIMSEGCRQVSCSEMGDAVASFI